MTRWKKSYIVVGAVVSLLCCCLPVLILWGIIGDVVWKVGVGWLLFLSRVAQKMTVDWAGMATASVALAGLSIGSHLFLRWLSEQIQNARQPSNTTRYYWRVQWTACLLGIVVLMFVAGVAAIGMTHQVTWLLSSPEPLIGGGGREWAMKTALRNNVSQTAKAVHLHHDEVKHFPAGATYDKFGRALRCYPTSIKAPFTSK
jgi:hypothetical protein